MLVENYRPDVKDRLGIGYEAMAAVNPRLVYGSISGYGEDGPYRMRPGFDQIAQGMGGLMSITGLPGQGPVRVGIPIADLCAGIFCAHGIMVALVEREKSGKGQWVKSSLLQAQLFMLDFQAARWLMRGEVAKQAGNNHPTSIPTGVYKTRDGYMNLAVTGTKIWTRMCEAIGAPQLATHPDYATGALRSKNRDALHDVLEEYFVKHDTAYWIEVLNKAGVPAGPIYSIDQAFADPQVQEPRHGAEGRRRSVPRPAGDAVAHAEPRRMRIRPSRASTPPRFCTNSATGTARSKICERKESCNAQRKAHREEGERRRLDHPEQPRAPQRHLARDVDRRDGGHAGLPRRQVGARVVVTGAGGKAFASGADISKFKDERQEAAAVAHYQETTQKAYDTVLGMPIPTIAMIRGYCIGGGTALAVCCDIRICTENAKFGVPAAKLGLGYGMNRAKPLVDLVGPAYAKEMFFTGRQFTAQEAEKMGLVNRVVPDDQLESRSYRKWPTRSPRTRR